MSKIYLPMSGDLLHIGHLMAIRQCSKKGEVTIGLLTDELIKKYKKRKPIISLYQRRIMLLALPEVSKVVRQTSLTPALKQYDWIASGDGFEPEECKAAERGNCKLLQIEYTKTQSTTKIINKILKIYAN